MKQCLLPQFIGLIWNEVSRWARATSKAFSGVYPSTSRKIVGSTSSLEASILFMICVGALSPLILGGELFASETHDTTSSGQPSPLIIQRIIIEPQNVFGANEIAKSRVLQAINRFHIPTRQFVIERESLLKVGDEFDVELAYETERNLRDLAFIYQASVTFDSLNSNGATLRIKTVDRWSLSAGLKVARKSERNLFQFGLTESNLFGLGHRIGATYSISKPDPSYFKFEYHNPRVLGSFNEFGLNIVNDPLNRSARLTAQKRFIHQTDPFSYRVSYLNFDKRDIDVTTLGDTAVTYFQKGNRVESGVSLRTGDFHRKLRVSAIYRYVNGAIENLNTFNGYTLDYQGKVIPPLAQFPTDTFTIPIDSALHELTFVINASRFDFYALERLKYQKRVEDVEIVNGIGLKFGQGRAESLDNHLYSIWGIGARYGAVISDFIFAGRVRRSGWIKGGSEIRSTFRSSLIAYHNGFSWVTFAGRAFYGFDRRKGDPNPLSVDGGSGVRGYPANSLTGNQLLVGNFETRFFTGLSGLTTRLGFALHFDFGTAWGDGDELTYDRFIWSAGPGLRLDMGQIGTVRVDISYLNSLDSWAISASTGQFFDLNPGN